MGQETKRNETSKQSGRPGRGTAKLDAGKKSTMQTMSGQSNTTSKGDPQHGRPIMGTKETFGEVRSTTDMNSMRQKRQQNENALESL